MSAKRFPPLPKVVEGAMAPIVIVVGPFKKRRKDNCGLWKEMDRTIHINAAMPLPQQHATLEHELVHAALTDAGVDELLRHKPRLLEAVCDAVSTARYRQRFG